MKETIPSDPRSLSDTHIELQKKVETLTRELGQAQEQQRASANVLKAISRSAFDLQVVLDTLVQSAASLCDAETAQIYRRSDTEYALSASYGLSPEFKSHMMTRRIGPGTDTALARVALEGRIIHIPDVLADPHYHAPQSQKLSQARAVVAVPLLREGTTIGILVLTRADVRPFTEKQIELLTTFADQAVIAIENVRLFEAEQQRTRELSESLEQQTATSEVLRIISLSPGDLQPVFQAMLEYAVRIRR
jgi:GAF domain-containing protein